MVFYVYMSPDVILDAKNGGPYAIQNLIGILLGFCQNCCLFEFKDNRWEKAVYSNADQLPPSNARKKIMVLLGELKKQGRFIRHLIPNHVIQSINIADVYAQAEKVLLDFLLAGENEIAHVSGRVETGALDNYNESGFESKRSNLASNGRLFQDSELDQTDFLKEVFKKVFMHTKRIEICDAIFGKYFGDNFEYSFSTLFKYVEKEVVNAGQIEKVVIHCRKPEICTDDHMKILLSRIKRGRLSNLKIEVRFYKSKEPDERLPALPHERFIMTDQVALNIGRGMDFLDKKTKRNRDILIKLAKEDEIKDSINRCHNWMIEPVII